MMDNFTREDLSLFRLLHQDIQLIADCAHPETSSADLRRLSAQLRHLLIEGQLSKGWRRAGFEKEPKIVAQRMNPFHQQAGATVLADKVKMSAMEISGIFYSESESCNIMDMNAEDLRKFWSSEGNSHEFRLTEYLDSCGVWFGDVKISRRQVIQYAANKIGGVHLDEKRKKDDRAFNLLDQLCDQGPFLGGSSSEPFAIADDARGPVASQLLATAQSVSESSDIKTLWARCDEIVHTHRGLIPPL